MFFSPGKTACTWPLIVIWDSLVHPAASSAFSDGWQDLHDNFKMDWEFDRAENGNIAVMGEIDLAKSNDFVVAIGFGDSLHAATAVLNQSLAQPFDSTEAQVH